mmetsp:Transcript_45040/g.86669  ORF Transcript_45040/g.86669 Transcript_45040/m.86669 type:complete len:100 (-) Transcript_45040:756-1055(-)
MKHHTSCARPFKAAAAYVAEPAIKSPCNAASASSKVQVRQQLQKPTLRRGILTQAICYGWRQALECGICLQALWQTLPQCLASSGVVGESQEAANHVFQ